MKTLFNNDLYLTREGIEIQDEFQELIRPFFEKYKEYNPIEFDWVLKCVFDMENARMYVNQTTEKNKS